MKIFDSLRKRFMTTHQLGSESLVLDPLEQRILKTISCRDCDYIPKVPNAGKVVADVEPAYQVMHNGVKVLLGGYHGTWMQRIITALNGHHEPQEEKIFYEVLKHVRSDPVMMELGSYWAYYSLWLRTSYPNAKNYMVEPIETNLDLGEKNFALNGVDGDFTFGCVGSEFQESKPFVNWDKREIEMPQYSVDYLLRKKNITVLDILHSDIQGAELEMLEGCVQSIEQKRIGYFFVSTHGDQHEPCLDFFRQRNMHIIAEHTIKESVSADGLIVAQSDIVPFVPKVEVFK